MQTEQTKTFDVLERQPWRTTQRENPSDYEQAASAGKWGMLLNAILNYQNKHHGLSPTDQILSKTTGLSVTQVRYHLNELEKAGLIKDNRGWPRIIKVEDVAKVGTGKAIPPEPPEKVEEVRTMDSTEVTGRSRAHPNYIGDFVSRATAAAKAITEHYERYGVAPGVKKVADALGYKSTGSVSLLIAQMVQRGWLKHKPNKHGDLTVTGAGRAALLDGGQGVSATAEAAFTAPPQPEPLPQATTPEPVATRGATVETGNDALIMSLVREMHSNAGLQNVSDLDLVLELRERGFKVSR